MLVRRTSKEDVKKICEIIDQAKQYMKNSGIDQWQNGYPNEETILEDIQTQTSYVLVDNCVVGTMRFLIEDDPDYGYIEGNWKTNGRYGVIHRIAIDENCKGKSYAKVLVDEAIQMCLNDNVHSLRIDTHFDNSSMRKFLKKNHFEECGIVYIRGVDKRIAYELQF